MGAKNPQIPAVLDITKIYEIFGQMNAQYWEKNPEAKANKEPSPFHKKYGAHIATLLRRDKHTGEVNNMLIDPVAVKELYEMFGPGGQCEAILPEIRGEKYPHREKDGKGGLSAFYSFGNVGEKTTLEDVQNCISLEAHVETEEIDGQKKTKAIELKHALLGKNANVIVLFYHECCSADKASLPLSALTIFHTDDNKVVATLKNSQSAINKHGTDVFMTEYEKNKYKLNYNIANDTGHRRLLSRIQHTRGEEHNHAHCPSTNSMHKPKSKPVAPS
ncbi:MAG: hypothetical protein MRY79_07970 [Alphaproteobacteria bacterium]|nr:hypothetical protein [Alphaproteobacteria bacterium]